MDYLRTFSYKLCWFFKDNLVSTKYYFTVLNHSATIVLINQKPFCLSKWLHQSCKTTKTLYEYDHDIYHPKRSKSSLELDLQVIRCTEGTSRRMKNRHDSVNITIFSLLNTTVQSKRRISNNAVGFLLKLPRLKDLPHCYIKHTEYLVVHRTPCFTQK